MPPDPPKVIIDLYSASNLLALILPHTERNCVYDSLGACILRKFLDTSLEIILVVYCQTKAMLVSDFALYHYEVA